MITTVLSYGWLGGCRESGVQAFRGKSGGGGQLAQAWRVPTLFKVVQNQNLLQNTLPNKTGPWVGFDLQETFLESCNNFVKRLDWTVVPWIPTYSSYKFLHLTEA